jgi:hypothetical protein
MTLGKAITAVDVRRQVLETLEGVDGDYDLGTLVGTVIARFGLCDVDDLPSRQYWAIVDSCRLNDG